MRMTKEEKVLQIDHLSVSYGEGDVVQDVSFAINQGEVLCIVGESGSGKSTLIKAIHGLENTVCRDGNIYLFGEISKSNSDRRKRMGKEIGLIPQNPGGSFNPLRTFEKQFQETFSGIGKKYDAQEIIATFEKVGLKNGEDILKSRPYEMSGGMNQRIAVAICYVLSPKLLLCDEATSALDVTTAGMVVRELMKLREEKNTSILMVTHHLGIARSMADEIAIMKDGKIVEYGSTKEIFEHPQNEYTKALLLDVPKIKGAADKDI